MKANPMSHLARIGLVVEVMHLITGTPTSRSYVNIVAKHISRRLKPSQRKALAKRFEPDTTIHVMKTVATMIHDGPIGARQ